MIEERTLDQLGFTGFEHLVKNKRDGKKRMIWVGVIDDHTLTVIVVYNDDQWNVDILDIDSEEVYKKFFAFNPTVEEVTRVISEYGHLSSSE